MYHPSRGGVRGGRDQFKWDDVKVDKHRENYLGHSVRAPVGRWQKAPRSSTGILLKTTMREVLGLAPKSSSRSQGIHLDKHEYAELVKRGSTTEDIGASHAEAIRVHGLGFSRAPRVGTDFNCEPVTSASVEAVSPGIAGEAITEMMDVPATESHKKRERYEKSEKHAKRHHSSEEKRKHKKDKGKKYHPDSDG